MSTNKMENRGPIKLLKSQDRFLIPITAQVRSKQKLKSPYSGTISKLPSSGVKKETMTSVNANGSRKLLKSPNFKIYSSRRFGSSVSSSCASIYRTYYAKNCTNNKLQQIANQQLRFLYRSFGYNHSHKPVTDSIAKYSINPPRAEDCSVLRAKQAMELSSSIQRDLMPIDSDVKERISVKRVPKLIKDESHVSLLNENSLPIRERISVPNQRIPLHFLKEENFQKVQIPKTSAESRSKINPVKKTNITEEEEIPNLIKIAPAETYPNRRFRATTTVRQRKILECSAPEVQTHANLSPTKKKSFKNSTISGKNSITSHKSEKSSKRLDVSKRGYHKVNTPVVSTKNVRSSIPVRRLWQSNNQKRQTMRDPVPVPIAAVYVPDAFERKKETYFSIKNFLPRKY